MGNVQVSVVVTFIARLIYFKETQLKANGKYHYLGDAGDLLDDGGNLRGGGDDILGGGGNRQTPTEWKSKSVTLPTYIQG